MKITFNNDGSVSGEITKSGDIIPFEISADNKDEIIKTLLNYYEKNCHFGEGIMQDDNSIIEAPVVLSDICDSNISFVEMHGE